ncbi:MAG: translesion DNA synthesis-associated protein ImuA [Gammaproteobacteria bacterium]|nr:translesion DNA synthesis-associated protein ImuA [Gammaproteobacteria bacterium]
MFAGKRSDTKTDTDASSAKRQVIDALLREIPELWRGHCTASPAGGTATTTTTGFPELDAILPAGGWPAKGLVEIVYSRPGMGELQLLLPLMRKLTSQGEWVPWIGPPLPPYAPALLQAGADIGKLLVIQPGAPPRNMLWSMEQALRCCRLVLAWRSGFSHKSLRRLQLAANAGNSLAVLFQRGNSRCPFSTLRLRLDSASDAPQVHILHARGQIRRHSARLTAGKGGGGAFAALDEQPL